MKETDEYTDERLTPGPQTCDRLTELLKKRATLLSELDQVRSDIVRATPEGFHREDKACCGSPLIGYLPRLSDPASTPTAEDPEPWTVLTATLKNREGCCSLESFPTEAAAVDAAWAMAESHEFVWPAESRT